MAESSDVISSKGQFLKLCISPKTKKKSTQKRKYIHFIQYSNLTVHFPFTQSPLGQSPFFVQLLPSIFFKYKNIIVYQFYSNFKYFKLLLLSVLRSISANKVPINNSSVTLILNNKAKNTRDSTYHRPKKKFLRGFLPLSREKWTMRKQRSSRKRRLTTI